MEPLKPYERQAILANRPNAQPGDIQEYERLLSMRFTTDPDFGPPAAPEIEGGSVTSPEERIAELHEKLFRGTREIAVAGRR